MAASGPLPQMLRMEVFSFAAELHGSFADLAKQLQECVRYLREGEGWHLVAAVCSCEQCGCEK